MEHGCGILFMMRRSLDCLGQRFQLTEMMKHLLLQMTGGLPMGPAVARCRICAICRLLPGNIKHPFRRVRIRIALVCAALFEVRNQSASIIADFTKVDTLAVIIQEQQMIKHTEKLRGWLADRAQHRLALVRKLAEKCTNRPCCLAIGCPFDERCHGILVSQPVRTGMLSVTPAVSHYYKYRRTCEIEN
jgi:hypothetical protein